MVSSSAEDFPVLWLPCFGKRGREEGGDDEREEPEVAEKRREETGRRRAHSWVISEELEIQGRGD